MADLKSKTEGVKFAIQPEGDLFAGMFLPVTPARARDIRTLLPSDLIDLALNDLEAVERNPKYRVEMRAWHEPVGRGKNRVCEVCLAGAVMANTLGCKPRDEVEPWYFDDCTLTNTLNALDAFRFGEVHAGLDWLGSYAGCDTPEAVLVADYAKHPIGFKSDLRAMADMLREKGL